MAYRENGRKRKSRSAKGCNPAGEKKKEKENEAMQNMKPVRLDAFKKNEAVYLGEMVDDNDPVATVDVMQQGVSYPQANEKETQQAVQELMNELNEMVDQSTQTSPPQPPPLEEDDDNEGFKRMVRMATIFQSPGFQNPRPHPPPSSVDYMVALCMRCVWRSASPKMCGNMSNVPSNPVCCFVQKTKATTI